MDEGATGLVVLLTPRCDTIAAGCSTSYLFEQVQLGSFREIDVHMCSRIRDSSR